MSTTAGLIPCYRVLITILLSTPIIGRAAASDYVGSQTCALCHQEIAQRQNQSRMAQTWHSFEQGILSGYAEQKLEGPPPYLQYLVASHEQGMRYEVRLPEREPIQVVVEAAIGESRHGITFLVRLKELFGQALQRGPLIAARYFHEFRSGGLALNPGFPPEKPQTLETALGWVLSAPFERRCLTCHGAPQFSPTAESGVRCEHCHGPGRPHLEALAKGGAEKGILNPARLEPAAVVALCGRCHSGFKEAVGAVPHELLISNQATALALSECYIQSNQGLSCISCHDPHENAHHEEPRVQETCLACHGETAHRAAVCPVESRAPCASCHMPEVDRPGVLPLVDHWIRVHPEKASGLARRTDIPASRVTPRRLFLRMIVVKSRGEAQSILARLAEGAEFFDLARQHSSDPSASVGGFLGELWVERMDKFLAEAARKLLPGETSEVLQVNRDFVILQRMPRDFRWEVVQIVEEGERLAQAGRNREAIVRFQEALKLHPHSLQALLALGGLFGELGELNQAIPLLEYTIRIYPRSPLAHFNLGVALGLAGLHPRAAAAYRSALELDPDMLAAHVNLGLSRLALGELEQARQAFLKAIEVNPLSAKAHLNLSRILSLQDRLQEAETHRRMALLIDPRIEADDRQ